MQRILKACPFWNKKPWLYWYVSSKACISPGFSLFSPEFKKKNPLDFGELKIPGFSHDFLFSLLLQISISKIPRIFSSRDFRMPALSIASLGNLEILLNFFLFLVRQLVRNVFRVAALHFRMDFRLLNEFVQCQGDDQSGCEFPAWRDVLVARLWKCHHAQL